MESFNNTQILAKINQSPYLTRKNLELLLGSNRRTVDYRIFSLIKAGVLSRLKSGFYISNEYFRQQADGQRYLEYIGCILKQPSYVSLRYALAKYNLIPEAIFDLTYVTTKKTKRIDTAITSFVYNNINEKLFVGFSPLKYGNKVINFAKPYKALFDLFYYAKISTREEIQNYVRSARINWEMLEQSDKRQLQKILLCTKLQKMQQLCAILQEEKLI